MGPEQPRESRASDHGGPEEEEELSGGTQDDEVGSGEPEGEAVSVSGGGAAEISAAAQSVSVNDLFELLARPGNRYALAYVVDADGPVPYEDLVEYVVDMCGTPDGVSTADFRNQIATRLVHSNLPKLDDAGLVDYDAEERTIRATEATELAVPYLELAKEQFRSE